SPCLSSWTEASVSIEVGLTPAFPNDALSAIEKQPAKAAPIISSGLLPRSPSKRVFRVKATSGPLAGFIVPFPSLNVPSQRADALLVDMVRPPVTCQSARLRVP